MNYSCNSYSLFHNETLIKCSQKNYQNITDNCCKNIKYYYLMLMYKKHFFTNFRSYD